MAAIIVTGIDNTGKSTLARQIMSRFMCSCYYTHSIGPCDSRKLRAWNIKHMIGSDDAVGVAVMDRFYLAELAYGPVVRGTNSFSQVDIRLLDRAAAAGPVFVVLAHRPMERIMETYAEREQMVPPAKAQETLMLVRRRYRTLVMDRARTKTFSEVAVYDWARNDVEELLDRIQSWGKRRLGRNLETGGR